MLPGEFAALSDLLPEPMVVVTIAGVIEACNRAFASLVGEASDALTGRRLDSLTCDEPADLEHYLRTCSKSGQMTIGAITLKCPAGWVAHRSDGVSCRTVIPSLRSPVLLRLKVKQEGMVGFITLNDKIAQLSAQMARREQVEQTLRKERETLQVTLASIGDGVVVTDGSGNVSFMNHIAQSLTGWSLESARGQPLTAVFQIVNEHTGLPVDDPVGKVISTNGIVGLANHTILLSRDGRRLPIDDSAAPIRLPSGELFGVVLIFRDVTEKKKSEMAQALLAAIIKSSDDAIVSKTLEGRVTSWNHGAEKLFGFTSEEIVGQSITLVIPPELHEEEAGILERLRRGEHIDHFETVRVAKDGRRLDISLTVSPIRNESGEIIGASKVARDISERLRTEAHLREADRRKDEFLAMLAHELRNPLAPIRNAATLMCSANDLRAPLRQACEIIERQVGHMTRLVDELLDVSRITSGHVTLRKEPVDLAVVLSLAVESCRPALDAGMLHFKLELRDEPTYVYGDSTRLAQVFSNILGNAAKYTPNGGHVSMNMRCTQSEAVVSVRDTGVGIPVHMLKHVFDLFAQVDRAYDRTSGGLGIGLSVAQRLIQMHDGVIEARSEGVNKGAEFIVRLPAIERASAPSPSPVRRQYPAADKRRVLIADDNQDAALSLSMLVETMGYEVQLAHDGLSALKIAEQFHPDVVLLDIGMPHLDGYGTVRRIVTRPWAAKTLLIALTGWGQEADRRKAREAGFHRHLVKPVDFELLAEILTSTRTDG